MILHKGKGEYYVGVLGEVLTLYLIEGDVHYSLFRLGINDWERLIATPSISTGKPTHFYVNEQTSDIYIWPVPDKRYDAKLRYCGPILEA